MTIAVGDKVNWMHEPRGGYGYRFSVAGVVVAVRKKRILINVMNARTRAIAQRLVDPSRLTPRNCFVDGLDETGVSE